MSKRAIAQSIAGASGRHESCGLKLPEQPSALVHGTMCEQVHW